MVKPMLVNKRGYSYKVDTKVKHYKVYKLVSTKNIVPNFPADLKHSHPCRPESGSNFLLT